MPTVTIGSDDYEVYVTVSTANIYLAGDSLRYPTWSVTSSDDKARAIISATRYIDRQRWQGSKTSDAQVLQFPRSGLTRADGTDVDEAEVPQEVLDATSILAGEIAADPSILNLLNAGSNIRRVQAGSAGVEYFKPTLDSATKLPTSISELLSFFLEGANTSSGEVFGTDYYDDSNNNATYISKKTFGRTQPF